MTRYGLNARLVGLDASGCCLQCGRDAHFKLLPPGPARAQVDRLPAGRQVRSMDWHGDIRSAHVQVRNTSAAPVALHHRRRAAGTGAGAWTAISLAAHESYRWILAKASPDEIGMDVALPPEVTSNLHEVFDRAHFPTVPVEDARAPDDVSPLPRYGAAASGELRP